MGFVPRPGTNLRQTTAKNRKRKSRGGKADWTAMSLNLKVGEVVLIQPRDRRRKPVKYTMLIRLTHTASNASVSSLGDPAL